MNAKQRKQVERDEAINRLREFVKPGDTVYTILRNVSRSGMSREISVAIMSDGRPHDITHNAAEALDLRVGGRGGLKVGGCGMDMGFHVVYSLSRVLYPDGFGCTGQTPERRCRSNDHSNGDRDYTSHLEAQAKQALDKRKPGEVSKPEVEPGHWHSDGGYALSHSWL